MNNIAPCLMPKPDVRLLLCVHTRMHSYALNVNIGALGGVLM